MTAFETQVGGDHYAKLAIQPMQYSMANGLDACQHTVVKYVTRFRDKGGIADLEKAKHVIDMLIELERAKVPAQLLEPVHDACAHHWVNRTDLPNVVECIACGLCKQK